MRSIAMLTFVISAACNPIIGPGEPTQSVASVDSLPPADSTGSITIIVCLDGVCPDGTILEPDDST